MSFIVYIAIILVLLGFLFVYTSIEVRKVPMHHEQRVPVSDDDLPEVDLSPAFASTAAASSFNADTSLPVYSENKTVDSGGLPADQPVHDEKEHTPFPVSLYIDEKGAVSFDDAGGIKDDLSIYGGLVRVGSGMAEVLADSVNVRIEKKLFRYDFYRVQEIKSRGVSAGIFVKGDYRGNIFIAENSLFAKVLTDKFTRYVNKG